MCKFRNILVSVFATVALLSITIQPVVGKGFSSRSSFSSSRSFSRPSYSSNRSKSSSRSSGWSFGSSKKATPKAKTVAKKAGFKAAPKLANKKAPVKSRKFAKADIKTKQKRLTAKENHKKYTAKFKKPEPKATVSAAQKATYSKSPYVKSSYGYDRSTRLNRRSSYYDSYQPSPYVYNSQPSFGMWDGLAMWYMLDHINDRNYSQMAYHQQNTAGFQEWRREADRLAADNAELKAKLNSLDREVGGMKGTPIDEGYAPKGVDRDILLSERVMSAVKPKLSICSGTNGGSYFVYGNKMRNALQNQFDVTVKPTNGTIDNLKQLEQSSCDVAIVQRDGYDLYSICSNAVDVNVLKACNDSGINTSKGSQLNFTRLSSPFDEAVFGICKGAESISHAKTVSMVGNSGSVITWNNLAMEFDKLNDVVITTTPNMPAAIGNVKNGTTDCAFLTVNTKSRFISTLDKLVDSDMHVHTMTNDLITKIQDPVGKPVYKFKDYAKGTFGKAGNKNSSGWLKPTLRSASVKADVIISNKFDAGLAVKVQRGITGIKL